MNITSRLSGWLGIGDELDDFVDEVLHGGEGTFWRRAVISWMSRHKRTLLVTLLIAGLYRIGTYIPIPGVLRPSIAELRLMAGLDTFSLHDLMTGGRSLSIFELGVLPYVYGSAGVQLAVLVWRALTRRGDRRPPQHTAIATGIAALVLCAWQAHAIASLTEHFVEGTGFQLVYGGWAFRVTTIATLTAGTALLMWLSDGITKRGIANGMLVTCVAGIVAGLPDVFTTRGAPSFSQMATLALVIALVAWTARGYRLALQAQR